MEVQLLLVFLNLLNRQKNDSRAWARPPGLPFRPCGNPHSLLVNPLQANSNCLSWYLGGWAKGGEAASEHLKHLRPHTSDADPHPSPQAQQLLRTPSHFCRWQLDGFAKPALRFSAQFLSAFPSYLHCSLSNHFQDLHSSPISFRSHLNLAQSTVAKPW